MLAQHDLAQDYIVSKSRIGTLSRLTMASNTLIPQSLIGREAERLQIQQILAEDGDFVVVGAPGIGRRTLIHATAQAVGAKVLELDCLRITSPGRFIQLLAETLMQVFTDADELAFIQTWVAPHPLVLEQTFPQRPRLVWHPGPGSEWAVFQALLALPQAIAEWRDCRIVILFLNFPHLRSWDRSNTWETYLRDEIRRQSRVSYALVGTVVEPWMTDQGLPIFSLSPLTDEDMQTWIVPTLAAAGFELDVASRALPLFLSYAQGHLSDGVVLARRIVTDLSAEPAELDPPSTAPPLSPRLIAAHHIHRSMLMLAEDFSVTFESLVLLLPPTQVRALESLALDPTDKPQARDYIQKHHLSRGGSLQGALLSLEQKGLIYGPQLGYRVALPFLNFWLKHRLG